jgi:NADH:ubiquinone oxidoreductase subunit 3 (subunit A)
MTATFLLPFAVGACSAVGGNVVKDAFGLVALVAMTPLIAIQILGLVYKIKRGKKAEDTEVVTKPVTESVTEAVDEDVIEL